MGLQAVIVGLLGLAASAKAKAIKSEQPMRAFLSYRRADAEHVAGRLYDRMVAALGKENVFFDIDTISYGADFSDHIRQHVRQSDVVLALIGKDWMGSVANHPPRIFDEADWVRKEIEIALEEKKRILPVTIGEAHMPTSSDLPESIRSLCRFNAAPLSSGRDFHIHADRIVAAIREG